jgi:hypothetical protein
VVAANLFFSCTQQCHGKPGILLIRSKRFYTFSPFTYVSKNTKTIKEKTASYLSRRFYEINSGVRLLRAGQLVRLREYERHDVQMWSFGHWRTLWPGWDMCERNSCRAITDKVEAFKRHVHGVQGRIWVSMRTPSSVESNQPVKRMP